MDQLLELLKDVNEDVDFTTQTAIIDDEVIDSLDLTGLIADIEDTFDIEIGMNDIVPENFNTVDAMWAMIQRLQG
ncbi:MAG: phosphopantetheine-binding protein [Coriobacteriaceae bacterium]|nr:phosphopantetheine-binding protein [Coriobacteriaceae bacterium]MDD6768846.1 phosphopantetheine-binding protein [Coriobacteriaceae bacterium]